LNRKVGIWVGVGAVAIAVVAVPTAIHVRRVSQRNECLNFLRQLTEPMTCCVPLSQKLREGDPMEPGDVLAFTRYKTLPRCPAGGTYRVSWVVGGPTPKCSYHGDLLWTQHHIKSLSELTRPKGIPPP
jgi:hypothetical protein